MVPFKPYFLGEVTPPYPRATSVQKCVRTPDIEEVGKTTRHGTFFQMCGNFSFGDYFKEGAIALRLGAAHRLPGRRRLRLRPGPALGHRLRGRRRGRADLARRRRRARRAHPAPAAWTTTTGRMGVPGPCGPCSEIYYDRGPEYGAEGGPAVDDDRYVEIWNLVFMQYERGAGERQGDFPILGDLPAQEHRHRPRPRTPRDDPAGRATTCTRPTPCASSSTRRPS